MRFAPLLLLLATFAPLAAAQSTPGDELSVYVMTMGPGDEIFEKFGHNTIRIVDRSTGDDMVYNWGMFDFGADGFFINFALGRLNYSMESMPYADTAAWYKYLDRSIWLQELNLTPAQKLKLRERCRWYDSDANRFYLYNYYTDNCSTRVRDVIDEAVGGQLKAQLFDQPTRSTFRWHTRRLTRDNVCWYLALDAVLGPATDRPISKWDEAFLPVKLSADLKRVNVTDADGGTVPLVKDPQWIYQSTRPAEAYEPPTWWPWFLFVGVAIAAVFAWLGRVAPRRKAGRVGLGIAATFYTLLLGLCGCVGLFMWFCTDHQAAWRNENLLEISPLALPLAFLIPAMFGNRPRVRKIVLSLTLAIAATTLIGLILSPILPQAVADPMALVLPINLALAFAVWNFVKYKEREPQMNADQRG